MRLEAVGNQPGFTLSVTSLRGKFRSRDPLADLSQSPSGEVPGVAVTLASLPYTAAARIDTILAGAVPTSGHSEA